MNTESQKRSKQLGLMARILFFTSFISVLTISTLLFYDLIQRTGLSPAKWTLITLYSVLTTGLAFGFCQSLFGFFVVLIKRSPRNISEQIKIDAEQHELITCSVALLFPVYNEDPERFFNGINATYEALSKAGIIEHFTIFILSDSTDSNRWVEEEKRWQALTHRHHAKTKIIYRHRTNNINQKSGNVSDFCRRWGSLFDYMICFDADSLMSAECILKLVQLIEANPQVGIIQTAPSLIGAKTLFARCQQFANRIHGEISSAGLNFWQQDNGNYWGHNAIIRVQPFIEKCALPELPGQGPLGGRVLSHDFVEAALMRKAGYEVWLAHEIGESYEELPQTLLDFAQRDRRWCQGNLQHSWIAIFGRIPFLSRIHMLNGIYAYLAAPLWLLFLSTSTLIAYSWESSGLTQLIRPRAFLQSPETLQSHGLTVLVGTLAMLFLPKVFTSIRLLFDNSFRKTFGSGIRAFISVLGEITFFTLIAPSLMLFHSAFVISTLTGNRVVWNAQNRGLNYTTWITAFSAHIGQTLVGVFWGILAWKINPTLFYWMSPVILGWLASIPLSVISSHEDFSEWLRAKGFLTTPEEISPPAIVEKINFDNSKPTTEPQPIELLRDDFGLLQIILDPYILALHLHFLPNRKKQPSETTERIRKLGETLLSAGAPTLSTTEKNRILNDPHTLSRLHDQVWKTPEAELPPWWRLAINRYNRQSSFVAELG